MTDISLMVNDDREVIALHRESASIRVGEYAGGSNYKITSIRIYQEPGQMAMINYAAVYVGDEIIFRIDLTGWMVEYKLAQEQPLPF